MKAFEIARRLDALPILVTILGIYWLTTTVTILTTPAIPIEIFVPASDPLNPTPDIENRDPNYIILSHLGAASRQSYVDASADLEQVSIEDFVSVDDAFWNAVSMAQRQEILEQSGLISDEEFMSSFSQDLTSGEVLDRVNQALANQIRLFEVVRNASGERFLFTGDGFVRWQPSHRFALIRIDGAAPLHCEDNPSIQDCLP